MKRYCHSIRCNYCGRFIGNIEFSKNLVVHELITPDSEYTREEYETFHKSCYLKSCGWHIWYNENCWVNPKIVDDPKSQDYTNYGFTIVEAYKVETRKLYPIKNMWGIPDLNISSMFNEMDQNEEEETQERVN